MDVEVCPIALSSALGKRMAQQNESQRFNAAFAPAAASPDHTPDQVAIFSGPGIEVVQRWWAESNRRWAERDSAKTRIVDPVIPKVLTLERT